MMTAEEYERLMNQRNFLALRIARRSLRGGTPTESMFAEFDRLDSVVEAERMRLATGLWWESV